MTKLIEAVNNHLPELKTTRQKTFFIKDGDNWTVEIGLSKKQRDKHQGVCINPGELRNYQTQLGMSLYIESKYYGDCEIDKPGRTLAQLTWTGRPVI